MPFLSPTYRAFPDQLLHQNHLENQVQAEEEQKQLIALDGSPRGKEKSKPAFTQLSAETEACPNNMKVSTPSQVEWSGSPQPHEPHTGRMF